MAAARRISTLLSRSFPSASPSLLRSLGRESSRARGISRFSTAAVVEEPIIPPVQISYTKNLINGQFVDAASGKTFPVYDPRTAEVIANVAEGDAEDIDRAVATARKAFDEGPWPKMTPYERSRIMLRAADLIEKNMEELAALETWNNGKPYVQSLKSEVPMVVRLLHYYAGWADKIHGLTVPGDGNYHIQTLHEPIGVAGQIVPWNFPVLLFTWKVAPALACGNTIVLKSAEQTPLTALYLAKLFHEAGLPPGVLNVVSGYGPTAGAALASHMDVDKLSFTGHCDTGKIVQELAAKSNLKPVTLELGGKSPFIIFDDADVDQAVELAHFALFYNQGQCCCAGSRTYVHERVYDEFVEKAKARAMRRIVGVHFLCETNTKMNKPKKLCTKTMKILVFTLLFISSAHSFYLPGVAPRDFQRHYPLNVKVNKLSSTKTQLPYDYYFLKYCKPAKIVNSAENLGEVLRGDRIENSVYEFEMREDLSCKVACRVKVDAESAKNFKEKIDDEYRVNLILDNLPVAVLRQRRDGSQSTTYEHGFRVGFKGNYQGSKEEKYFINNHLSFRVMYHKDRETDSARIVGFEVTPNSINHEYKEWDEKNPQVTTCNKDTKNLVQGTAIPQEVDKDKEIVFTYDVTFKESDIKWASRWDTYLLMNDDQIHWFSIINSLMIVLFLSGMVAMIMMRTLYRDIANYNQLETQEEAQEETGWKLVHGDVFRAPTNAGLLCVYVGTGVQIFGMTLVTMIFALLGFLSPSNRGGLMTAMVLLWVFMGLFAGYASARLYKMFKGTEWKRNTLKTAFMFPGILFAVFFVLNALIWGEQSSGAVPFGTMFALVFLWFGISVPLVFVGSYLGFKKPAIEDPVKTNKIPRQIPEQAWYMTPVFSILIGGILPFGAVFIELFFILTSIWLNQFYYIFGFLFIVFVILLITCAEITIVLCYFQLCSEDYHWWWRSYLTAGSSALYLFLYSIFYFFTKLEITKLVSGILYFGYMVIVSYAFFVLTGTIGFYACFWFVRKIYSSVKID